MCPSASVGRIPIITWWAPTLERLLLGVVERAAQALLEGRQAALAELGRRHVDLDVELAELGLEVGVGDGLEHLGVLQGRVARVVDEVELHLETGHRVVGVERRLAQHPREHVEVAAHLLAVARAVGPAELLLLDLFAHDGTLVTRRPCRKPPDRAGLTRPGPPLAPTSGCSVAHVVRRGRGLEQLRDQARPASGWARASRQRSTAHHARAPSPASHAAKARTAAGTGHVGGRKAAHRVGPELDGVPRIGPAEPRPCLVAPLGPVQTLAGDGRQLGRGEGGAGADVAADQAVRPPGGSGVALHEVAAGCARPRPASGARVSRSASRLAWVTRPLEDGLRGERVVGAGRTGRRGRRPGAPPAARRTSGRRGRAAPRATPMPAAVNSSWRDQAASSATVVSSS